MRQLVAIAQVLMGILFLAATPNGQQTEPPFVAVWNSPTYACEKNRRVDIPISEYGIIENTGGGFKGDKVVIFYEKQIGLYPRLEADQNPINGGIPQKADFEAHFIRVEKDIEFNIPDKDFSGYAIIDWESWRPLYDFNWSSKRMYRKWSEALVEKDHPDWNKVMVEEEARKQFDAAARRFMEGTLEKAKDLRPKAKWGFYGFPRCHNTKGQATCPDYVQSGNDQLGWLFEASKAIYPSAYIRPKTVNPRNYVYGQNTEALRIHKKFSNPEVPVILYTGYMKKDTDFYSKKDLDNSLQLAMDQGISGVLIWGSSDSCNTVEKCHALANYMNEIFGPYIQEVMKKAATCSKSLCNSNGRCYKKDPLYETKSPDITRDIDIEDALLLPDDNRIHDVPNRIWKKQMMCSRQVRALYQEEYLCRCYLGWNGDQCDHQMVN